MRVCTWGPERSRVYRACVRVCRVVFWWVYAELEPFYWKWLPGMAIRLQRANLEHAVWVACNTYAKPGDRVAVEVAAYWPWAELLKTEKAVREVFER